MIYAYYRVSTDKQDFENQKLGVINFCRQRNFIINKEYIDDGISGTIDYKKRKLGFLIKKLKENDIIICSEISRLGRKLLDIMEILKILMENKVILYTVKENYELGDNIQSKVLAFAFGLSAEIERQLISERTREALIRKKQEGMILGRPKGSKNKILKLSGKEEKIKIMLNKKYSIIKISKILNVYRTTVSRFIKNNNLL